MTKTTQPTAHSDSELMDIARKHWHTGHGGVDVPCFSFDSKRLDMFLKDVTKWADRRAEKRVVEAQNQGQINALSHVLVYGATGRKHIGLSRSYVVFYLAEKQRERRGLWNRRKSLATLKQQLKDMK